jgi:prephenate dehydrogenase
MLAGLLLDAGAHVCVVDNPAKRADAELRSRFEPGDITRISAAVARELRRADLVLLAVPERPAVDSIAGIASYLAPGALLVDTLSVKREVVAAVRAHAPQFEAVSLNPMFAPSLGMDGRAVAAVVVRDGVRAQGLLRLLDQRGARIVQLTEDEHDRLVGAAQTLTHATVLAFGLALAELGIDAGVLAEMAPPPCQALLAMLARLTSGAAETYWDIQAANRHAAPARRALARSVRRLDGMIDGDQSGEFRRLLADLRDGLGSERVRFEGICSRMFERLGRVEHPDIAA